MIIAVVNLKGGVGKSTISVNLACELHNRKKVVALVDADAQGTATEWAAGKGLPVRVEALPIETQREAPHWIRRVLALKADHVVIDCPPRLAAVTEAAVGIADLVLVPVGPSGADLAATASALALIGQARAARKDKGPHCLLIPSRVDRRTASGRELDEVLREYEEPVGPVVHQRSALVDAFSAGQWIGEYAPTSPAYEDFKALAGRVVKAT